MSSTLEGPCVPCWPSHENSPVQHDTTLVADHAPGAQDEARGPRQQQVVKNIALRLTTMAAIWPHLPAAGKSGHHCFQRCNDICHTVSKHLDSGRSVHEEACTLQKCAPTASFSPVQVPNKHKHGSFDFSGHKGHTPQFLGITRQRSPGSPLSPGLEQAGEVASTR